MTKFLRSYRKQVNKWKYKNQKINRKLNKMSGIISELKKQKLKLPTLKFEEIKDEIKNHINNTPPHSPESKIIFNPVEEINDKMNVNISILNASMMNTACKKENINKQNLHNLTNISQLHNPNSSKILDEKLINFSHIFEKITSKFEEVGKAITKMSTETLPKHSLTNRQTNDLLYKSMVDSPKEWLRKINSPNHSRVISNSHIECSETSNLKQNLSPNGKKLENTMLGNISMLRGSTFTKYQNNQLSLKPVKEICIKINSYHDKTHFEPYKLVVDNLDILEIINKSRHFTNNEIQHRTYRSNRTNNNQTSGSQKTLEARYSQKPSSNVTGSFNEESNQSQENNSSSKKKNYPDEIKSLYKKYFKYTDNFMRDTLKDSPAGKIPEQPNVKGIRSTLNKKLGLNGVVKFTPQISQLSQEKLKLMSYLKTSIYLKSIVNRSNWVKNKD
jgi:hypothetical protein